MKIRSGFVSNSSSSSFIVLGEKPEGVSSVLLEDEELIENIIKSINNDEYKEKKIVWDGKQPVYLTQFISDSGRYTEPFEHLDYYSYGSGEHGQVPYGWDLEESDYWMCYSGDAPSEDEFFMVSDAIFVKTDDLPEKFKPKKVEPSTIGTIIEAATALLENHEDCHGSCKYCLADGRGTHAEQLRYAIEDFKKSVKWDENYGTIRK